MPAESLSDTCGNEAAIHIRWNLHARFNLLQTLFGATQPTYPNIHSQSQVGTKANHPTVDGHPDVSSATQPMIPVPLSREYPATQLSICPGGELPCSGSVVWMVFRVYVGL